VKPDNLNRMAYPTAPFWAQQNLRNGSVVQDVSSLLVLRMPGESKWVVASLAETDAIADPQSLVGRLLRSHCDCGLLSLPHLSHN
jgi:hypothetical protein